MHLTAQQLAERTGEPVEVVRARLADECRDGKRNGREFNGAIYYEVTDEELKPQ